MKHRPLLLGAISLLIVGTGAAAQNCPTRPYWPTDEWRVTSATALSEKSAAVKALEDYAFTLTGKDEERKGLRTDGLLIVKGGEIIYERYGRGFGPNNKHLSWSVAKSYSTTLIGVAVKKGLLSIDDSVCEVLTEFKGKEACKIKIKHVMTFSSGLNWREEYENAVYQVSSVIAALYGEGRRDQIKFTLSHPFYGEPGKVWRYSTGDSHVVASVAKRVLTRAHGADAFWTEFFDKLGMRKTTFEEDATGNALGGSYVWATPRDFARFGFFALNDGCWNGERLLPEGWMKAATTPSEVYVTAAYAQEKSPSGYSWWLNAPIASRNQPSPGLTCQLTRSQPMVTGASTSLWFLLATW
jgi:CubicO group peptidase (beta-lactamase class C family)